MAYEFKNNFKSNEWEDSFNDQRRNKKTGETRDKWVQLDNGLKYDPDTGETVLYRDNQLLYRYDPAGNQTQYGGQSFAGKLDPRILDTLTEKDMTKASDTAFNSPFIQQQLGKLETNPFIVGSEVANYGDAYADKQYTSALKPLMGTAQAYSMTNAYTDALKRFQGKGLFDELSGMDFSSQRNSSMPPAMDAANIPNKTNAPKSFGADPSRPYSHVNTSAPQKRNDPMLDQQLKDMQKGSTPDWGKLYEQISGYFGEAQKKQQLGTAKPRQQLGSFQQFSPTIQKRQQSYVSSTPSSGKAG